MPPFLSICLPDISASGTPFSEVSLKRPHVPSSTKLPNSCRRFHHFNLRASSVKHCCGLLLFLRDLEVIKMNYTGRDWLCGACQHVNFGRRDARQLCGYPKSGGSDQASTCGSHRNSNEGLPGDWLCSAENCGAHNHTSRSRCFRCVSLKDDNNAGSDRYGLGSCSLPPPGWKPSDWMCSSCGAHNYACREEHQMIMGGQTENFRRPILQNIHLYFLFNNVVRVLDCNR